MNVFATSVTKCVDVYIQLSYISLSLTLHIANHGEDELTADFPEADAGIPGTFQVALAVGKPAVPLTVASLNFQSHRPGSLDRWVWVLLFRSVIRNGGSYLILSEKKHLDLLTSLDQPAPHDS